ncbi:MAG: cytochrome c biogenesis protein CcsA [Candidatus Marinimicrobia bacterium]|nr:cytochrome c biogenesis protein CcsA [Candidatus Neomarinimicrobiota bacterium]MBL7046762.1 cytochrome c biogenesis protein CcsA [Candidatus Neomarinimicrobiota bacterium]
MTETLYQNLFWYTFIFYLAGFVCYALYFSSKKEAVTKVGIPLFFIGLALQTMAFIVKWYLVGAIRFQNMFEHLMLMSWAGVAIMLYVVLRYRSHLVGIVLSPIIIMLNAAAALLDKTPNENLMPALQSNWLTIHISLAALGSGAFVVAGTISLLYLLKDHNYSSQIKEQKRQLFSLAVLCMVYIPVVVFLILKIFNFTPHHTAFGINQVFESRVAYMNARTLLGQLVIVLGVLLVPMISLLAYLYKKRINQTSQGFGGVLFAIFILTFVLSSLLVGILAHNKIIFITPQRHMGSIWRFFEFIGSVYILSLLLFPLFYHLIYKFSGPVINKISGKMTLINEINYRAVSLGYPLYTVGALFAGAIWAEQAWGSFWSWDPKEVGSLLVWFFYSAVLHARHQRDWRGGRLAILSIIGTIMIFITFYGNYFFGGLHAYA